MYPLQGPQIGGQAVTIVASNVLYVSQAITCFFQSTNPKLVNFSQTVAATFPPPPDGNFLCASNCTFTCPTPPHPASQVRVQISLNGAQVRSHATLRLADRALLLQYYTVPFLYEYELCPQGQANGDYRSPW